MSLKYRIALTIFLLEAAMVSVIVWQLGSAISEHAIQEVRVRTITIAIAGMSVTALAGMLMGFLLTRRLERLVAATESLARGQMQVNVGFRGNDEVARLGRSFDEMAGRINTSLTALKASEARNRVLVEYCPAAIFVFDPVAFRLIDVNQKWVELLKYPREQIIGMTPLDASPPLQKGGRATEAWAAELVSRVSRGETPTAPWMLRDSTGVDIPCELQLTRYPEEGKNLILGIIYDVTEREKLTEKLDRRITFEDLLVRMSARFIGLKPDAIDDALNEALGELGRFAGVDRSYVFQFGNSNQTESCTHEWCAKGIEPAIDRLQNVSLSDYPWFMERIGRGEVLHVPDVSSLPPEAAAERQEFEAENIKSVVMVPLVFEGAVSGYMGFDAVRNAVEWPAEIVSLLKITGEIVFNALHRKRIESRLRQQARVQTQLNVALARSNEELQQFAYVASHDLREPLRAISGFSSLLASNYRDKLDKDANEFIDFIIAATARMDSMVRDLLTYSRVDMQPDEGGRCDMEAALRQVQSNLLASIQECQADITSDRLPVVGADTARMTQLLQNLIANAIKFREKDVRPRIHIGADSCEEGWRISVCDNGIGIDPKQAEAVFSIFKRLHSSDRFEGTGIGLAVCKRIVERWGGRIWVEPNKTGGSVFYFTVNA